MKNERIFQLDQLLQNRRTPASIQLLCEHLECSQATMKRLIRDMRERFGAPIVNIRGSGYRYDPSIQFELPGLLFSPSELVALLSIKQLIAELHPNFLEKTLSPVQQKINRLLGNAAKGVNQEIGRIRLLGIRYRQCNEPCFDTVVSGLLRRKKLSLHYHSRASRQQSQREVSPQRLVYYRDNWYCDGYCHLRQGLRSFSVDRISNVRMLEESTVDIDEEVLDETLGSAYGILAGKADKEAVLRFNADRAQWVAYETWHPQQTGKWQPDGGYELRFPYHLGIELIMDICRYGPDVEVIAPEALRMQVAQRLQQAASVYQKITI